MKRPIFIATISYINGILIGVYLQDSIPLIVCVLIIFILLIINKNISNYILNIKKYRKFISKIIANRNKIIFYIVIVIITASYIKYVNFVYLNKYNEIDNKNVYIVGTIVSDIEESEYCYQFTLKINSLNNIMKYKNDCILIIVKKNKKSCILNYGMEIKIKGIIQQPNIARNYKGFDYKGFLKSKKIYTTFCVNNIENIEVKCENNINVFNKIINILRNKIKENFRKILPKNTANLAIGILIGDNTQLDEDIIENFKNSNLSHMLAVSGTHVSYVVLTINLIFSAKKIRHKKAKDNKHFFNNNIYEFSKYDSINS